MVVSFYNIYLPLMFWKFAVITFRKFVTAMFYKLQESVCNTIHYLLEYMGSAFKDVVLIVNPVCHGVIIRTKFLKVLHIY